MNNKENKDNKRKIHEKKIQDLKVKKTQFETQIKNYWEIHHKIMSKVLETHYTNHVNTIGNSSRNHVKTIGISFGASAPEILVENFISSLKEKFKIIIEEVEIIKEEVTFKIPGKLN